MRHVISRSVDLDDAHEAEAVDGRAVARREHRLDDLCCWAGWLVWFRRAAAFGGASRSGSEASADDRWPVPV